MGTMASEITSVTIVYSTGRRSKKTSKLRVNGLCVGNSPGTGEFPAQMASYAENVSIWWRHHAMSHTFGYLLDFGDVTSHVWLSNTLLFDIFIRWIVHNVTDDQMNYAYSECNCAPWFWNHLCNFQCVSQMHHSLDSHHNANDSVIDVDQMPVGHF